MLANGDARYRYYKSIFEALPIENWPVLFEEDIDIDGMNDAIDTLEDIEKNCLFYKFHDNKPDIDIAYKCYININTVQIVITTALKKLASPALRWMYDIPFRRVVNKIRSERKVTKQRLNIPIKELDFPENIKTAFLKEGWETLYDLYTAPLNDVLIATSIKKGTRYKDIEKVFLWLNLRSMIYTDKRKYPDERSTDEVHKAPYCDFVPNLWREKFGLDPKTLAKKGIYYADPDK